MIARINAADSGTGEELLLPAIAAVCLGGTSLFGGAGGVVGTAIGSLILALVVNGMNMLSIAHVLAGLRHGRDHLLQYSRISSAEPLNRNREERQDANEETAMDRRTFVSSDRIVSPSARRAAGT